MPTITLPKELSENKDFIVVPRSFYEEFLVWQKKVKSARTFKPTKAELKELNRARKDFAAGKYITLEQLKDELGIKG
ncbi:hypothetical protein HY373_02155 [Candidatus Berkelbacteria bacterium]|nr:hypothetical protein [Candidatus Berkelbacteria bacterium]